MEIREIVELAVLGIAVLGGLFSLIIALVRGEIKKYVENKMVEAEKSNLTGAQKLEFVLSSVQEKYKLVNLFLNSKKFIEHIIELSKKINNK